MQFPARGQILDGHDLRAIHLAQQQNACIDGLVMHAPAPYPAKRHGTGTAIAFGAALLRADPAFLKPQIIQKRGTRVKA
jgi:hypothetical protein